MQPQKFSRACLKTASESVRYVGQLRGYVILWCSWVLLVGPNTDSPIGKYTETRRRMPTVNRM